LNKTILDLGLGADSEQFRSAPGLASSAVETAFSVMSANGTKRTYRSACYFARFRAKADIAE
jgi:hypothetical protein